MKKLLNIGHLEASAQFATPKIQVKKHGDAETYLVVVHGERGAVAVQANAVHTRRSQLQSWREQ